MAGAIAEIAHKTMFRNFRKIKPEQFEIYLIEGGDRLLTSYPPSLQPMLNAIWKRWECASSRENRLQE